MLGFSKENANKLNPSRPKPKIRKTKHKHEAEEVSNPPMGIRKRGRPRQVAVVVMDDRASRSPLTPRRSELPLGRSRVRRGRAHGEAPERGQEGHGHA